MKKLKLHIFLLIPLLLMLVLMGGINCTKKSSDSEQPEVSQVQSNPGGPGRGRGQGGRGRGLENRGRKAMNRTDSISLTDAEKSTVSLQTAKASLMPMRSHLDALGKVMAHQQRKAIVSYAFPARISKIHIRIGDWVKQGQRLVTLQSEEVGSAKSEFYKAQSDYELAKVNYEREKRLFDRGVGAKKDFISTEAELKVAEANFNAAEKKLHVLGFSEEEVSALSESHQINPIITLFAPITGKIIQNNAILGGMVDQGTEILVIMDPTILCIDADIYEKDIAKIKIGQKVEASVPAYPGETYLGETRYISDVLNEETRTITVRTQVENHNGMLKAGMFADIKIFLNHEAEALVVPAEAILEDKGDKIVFIRQRDGSFRLQVVEIGARENGFIEILGGLSEGDEIVTKGSYQLKSKLYEEILKKGQVH